MEISMHKCRSIMTEQLLFYHVTARSLEISINIYRLFITQHFSMLIEDLWTFPYTSLDQLSIDILHFTMFLEDLWKFPYPC